LFADKKIEIVGESEAIVVKNQKELLNPKSKFSKHQNFKMATQ
jgi:hypothetical protein